MYWSSFRPVLPAGRPAKVAGLSPVRALSQKSTNAPSNPTKSKARPINRAGVVRPDEQQEEARKVTASRDETGHVIVKIANTTAATGAAGCMHKCLTEHPHLLLQFTSTHAIYSAARALGLVNLMHVKENKSVFFVPTLEEVPASPVGGGTPKRTRRYQANVYAEPLMDEVVEGDVQRVTDHATDWRSYRKARGVNDDRAHAIADVLYDALDYEGDAVVVADTHGEVVTAMHATALCNRRIKVEGRNHMLGCTILFESSLKKGGRRGRLLFYAEKRIMPAAAQQAAAEAAEAVPVEA